MKLVDLVLDWLEKHELKDPPIRLEYKRVADDLLEVIRYHKRTGDELYDRFCIRIAPHNAKSYANPQP
jgi:hypothetical protein